MKHPSNRLKHTRDSDENGDDRRNGGRVRLRKHRSADDTEVSTNPQSDGEVGYQKPPPQHQWPKGKSGNPAGRKKGSKNKKTIIIQLMEQKLGRKIADLSKLTRYEAMLLKGIQKALTGDTKAMSFILRRYDDAAEAQAVSAHAPSQQDEVVYAALIEKLKRELLES